MACSFAALMRLYAPRCPVCTSTGAAKEGAKRLRVHCLTDGRDVEDGTSKVFVERLQKVQHQISLPLLWYPPRPGCCVREIASARTSV